MTHGSLKIKSRAEGRIGPGVPFRETGEYLRFELACDETFERPTFRLVIAEAGLGKSTMAEHKRRKQEWPILLPEVLQNMAPDRSFNLVKLTDIFRRYGLLSAPDALERRFIDFDLTRGGLEGFHLCAHDRLNYIQVDRAAAVQWAEELGAAHKIGEADRIRLHLELGAMGASIPYHIVLRRGSHEDTPGILLAELCREFWGDDRAPRGVADRRYAVHNALSRLRVLLIWDEADSLSAPCLHFSRSLHDICGVGIILLGTDVLLGRLNSERLKPVGTRSGPILRLGPPTLRELKGALQDVPDAVLARAWARSDHNMRVFGSIIDEVRRAVSNDRSLRPTPALVDDIAALLPCARPAMKGDREDLPVRTQDDAMPAMTSAHAGRRPKTGRGR